ncbi:MAG: monovalent cation/H(+) antiporter subunit G [Eubacteriales bacterium]
MTGWIRFAVSAVFIVTGLISFASGVIGNCRFGYVMNRVHAGGIGDTQGLFFIVLGLAAGEGSFMDILKLALLVVFMWNTSPVASHFLRQVEYYTNPNLYDHMERK